jgi:hypothetical protein
MKRVDFLNWKLVLVLLFLYNSIIQAEVYYVSTTGKDGNAGTIISPWATWGKAISTANAGDTVYFRGGVYYVTTAQISSPLNGAHNGTRNNPICYFNYPGEVPILDCSRKTRSSEGLYFYDVHNIHIKGLTVRNNRQIDAGDITSTNFYFYLGNNIIVENCVAYNAGMRGFYFYKTDTAYIYKCDAYNCADSKSSAPGNAGDGFLIWDNGQLDDLKAHIVLKQCRSWHNSDDGYDVEIEGYLEMDSCMAFNNGYLSSGNGMGFKYGLKDQQTTLLTKKITNCIAAYNKNGGFNTNDSKGVTQSMRIYNNLSYHNNQGYIIFNTANKDEQELQRIYKNNIAYANTDLSVGLELNAIYTHENNSWDIPDTINDLDFVSLDSAQLRWPRKANGSLPDITFGRLDPSSDLIDAGQYVGIRFNGTAPDLGAFESGTIAANNPPFVDDIPDQSIAEGGMFSIINLNNYVVDPDNTYDQIKWTFSSNGQFTITINQMTNVATIVAKDAEFNGFRTITFTATDPGGLYDSDQVTFTVTAVNDAPIVSDIPNQSIAEGGAFAAINLNNYVVDADNTDNEITWTFSGSNQLSVTIDQINKIATVNANNAKWNGSETITFMATDPGGLNDSDPVTFAITPVNDIPVMGDIPDQTIAEGGTFATINLNNFVDDPDNTDDQITWTYSGNSQLTVAINQITKVTTIVANSAEWNGSETITFKATDPGGLFDTDQAAFAVTSVNDAPLLSDIPNQKITIGQTFASINLNNYVADPDNADDQLTWTFSGNSQLSVAIDQTTKTAVVSPKDTEWTGSETITFMATDLGGLYNTDQVIFTVAAINSAPVVGDIPDQVIAEGGIFAPINLSDFVVDPDNSDDQITWTLSGNSQLDVAINQTTKVASVTAKSEEWSGSETITFKATDQGNLYDTDQAIFTVFAVNDAPVMSDIPHQTITKGGAFTSINLNNYVADPDNTDDQLTWTFSGNTQLTVNVNQTTKIAAIAINNPEWVGFETITFKATDPRGLFDNTQATFLIKSVDNPPEIENRNAIKVFPNPSDGKLTISLNDLNKTESGISITDMEGRIVFEQHGFTDDPESGLHIDVSHLRKGIYIIVLRDKNRNYFQRVVID